MFLSKVGPACFQSTMSKCLLERVQTRCKRLLCFFVFLFPLAWGQGACVHLTYAFSQNPLETSPENLLEGKRIYLAQCASCHGEAAEGDGVVADHPEFKPTNLVAMNSQWSDGVFQIRMTKKEKNGMPSFRETLTEEERWKVILFVRSLTPVQPAP